jgi:hypothetical protein
MVTKNQKERLQTIASLFTEFFKVLMACLLLVFVPQHCPETGQTCTFKENFTDLNTANKAILSLNFYTLILFLSLYYFETKRQFYFTKELDTDKSLADNNLIKECKESKKENIIDTIQEMNKKYLRLIRHCFSIYILNTILSIFVIVYYFYDGFRSITSLITNFLLISSKLWSDWSIIKDCVTSDCIALSTALNEPVSFNTIDSKRKSEIQL